MKAQSGETYRKEFDTDRYPIALYCLQELSDPDDFRGPHDHAGQEFYIVRYGRHVINDSSEEIGEGLGYDRFPTVEEAIAHVEALSTAVRNW